MFWVNLPNHFILPPLTKTKAFHSELEWQDASLDKVGYCLKLLQLNDRTKWTYFDMPANKPSSPPSLWYTSELFPCITP